MALLATEAVGVQEVGWPVHAHGLRRGLQVVAGVVRDVVVQGVALCDLRDAAHGNRTGGRDQERPPAGQVGERIERQIGRAAWRERVWPYVESWVVAVALKRTT